MSKEVALKIVKTSGSIVAMVLIWRLVEAALLAGIDGAMFFGGVAAIAGLGGYNIQRAVEAFRVKTSPNNSSK